MKKGEICVLVCMLMMLTTVVSVSAITVSEKISYPLVMGNTLYVGGFGPNNYTKIQDAIDNASVGDTVFVFDDSSPYYENIVVGKSLMIQGENKYTTIIDGANNSNGVTITSNDVTVTGFTIQNCGGDGTLFASGIFLSSSNNRIINNRLIENHFGISNIKNYSIPLRTECNSITNNQIISNGCGIYFVNVSNDTISGNIVSQSEMEGIFLMATLNTNISFNIISENGGGVMAIYTYNTMIYRNNISYNGGGVSAIITSADKILQNNFIGNNWSAVSSQIFLGKLMNLKFYLHVPILRNVWNENYWDGPRSFPYIIFGVFKLRFCIDWHPAQEPYTIPGML